MKDGAYWPESKAAIAAKGKKYVITPEQRNFWSLTPVKKPAIPTVKNTAWAKGDLDRLVLARMEEKNVVPAPAADRRTLLRRAYYDLVGLPPTAAQIDAFVADKSPNAFAKVVDQLLASRQYGERWGRYWLDLARYSDDKLEAEVDAPYANAFRYRDWVINALNQDMPYDQFLKAQIAGDLMGDKQKYAAGLGLFGLRPHTQDDRVDVTGRVFLGLTTGCAQCHDHKFDPIPTTDYYALLGIFESTQDGEFPLADEATVKNWKAQKKLVDQQKLAIRDFLHEQATSIARMFALQTARYVTAARAVIKDKQDRKTIAAREARWRDVRPLDCVSLEPQQRPPVLEGLEYGPLQRPGVPGARTGGAEGTASRGRREQAARRTEEAEGWRGGRSDGAEGGELLPVA